MTDKAPEKVREILSQRDSEIVDLCAAVAARAVEAERERCARIAEAEAKRHATEAARYRIDDDKARTLEIAHDTARAVCDRIAAAIREGKG